MSKHQVTYYKKIEFHIIRKITLILICQIFSVSFCLKYLGNCLQGNLYQIAIKQVNNIATSVVNVSIEKCITSNLETQNVIIKNLSDSGIITSVEFNMLNINNLATSTTLQIHDYLIKIQKGEIINFKDYSFQNGIIYQIPFGLTFNNPLIANMGPNIPIQYTLLGDIKDNIVSRISQYGINNALIEIILEIAINVQVIIPMQAEISTFKYDIPLAIVSVNGVVPDYYQGMQNLDSNFVVPLQ